MKTLAIETSCDDTSISIVKFENNVFEVEKMMAYSQINEHQKYGGVVPEIASRIHSEKIIPLIMNFITQINKIDFLSITTEPGLPGSLIVGKSIGNFLSEYYNKKIMKINHIHGHIFSLFLERNLDKIEFPMLVLTASGGHNDIYLITKTNKDNQEIPGFDIKKLGQTLDDSAGECFDKVSRMLGGPYPGGPRISQRANKHKIIQKSEYEISRTWLDHNNFDFSFSGTKSQVKRLINKLEELNTDIDEEIINEISYEFQESVVEVLAKKTLRAGLKYDAKTIGIAGGVSANQRLFQYINNLLKNKSWIANNSKQKIEILPKIIRPKKKLYSTDNSAMIGVVGLLKEL